MSGMTALTEAVARNLFKLMAYKDEYEVARLLTDPGFLSSAGEAFPGGTVFFNLHPPVLRAMGRKKKISFGPTSQGSLRALARMKSLRGTRADVFGYAHLRKVEDQMSDGWHTLDCRGKYAGEIRIEFTYYDTRPKAEKAGIEKKKETAQTEGASPTIAGPRGARAAPG